MFTGRGKKFKAEPKKKTSKVSVKDTIEIIKGYKDAEESLPYFNIKGIELSLLTDEEKEEIQTVEINKISVESKGQSGYLLGNDLGATTVSKCGTCNLPLPQCSGHVGIIRFPKGVKVYLPLYFEDLLVRLLNCVCYLDGTYFLSLPTIMEKLSDKKDLPVSQKLTELKKQSENAFCRNNPDHIKRHYSVRKTGKFKELVYTYGTSTEKVEADIDEIDKILFLLEAEKNKDTGHEGNEITEYLGIFKLRALIMRSILVPPYYLRQGFECKGNMNDHDITKTYQKILKHNIDYKNSQKNDRKPVTKSELSRNLFFQIESLHKDSGNTYSNTKKNNNIDKDLKGKKGAVRRIMLGKVNTVVARAVIDGDSRLRLEEVMIPYALKYTLHIPVEVTADNYDVIASMMKRGEIAKIEYKSGDSKGNMLPVTGGDITLSTGDIAYRHLRDGDLVILNRQPSLWIGNMLAFVLKLNPDKRSQVFKFNQALCGSYNADYDGDEMNLSVPQTIKGQIEAREKLFVTENLISRHKSAPSFNLILDNVISFFFLTKRKLSKNLFDLCFNEIYTNEYSGFCDRLVSNGMMDLRKISRNSYRENIIPGKILISALFPNDFYFRNGLVYIRNGVVFDDTNISKSIKSIVHQLDIQYNSKTAIDFINCAGFALNIYLDHVNFTVSLSDYYLDSSSKEIRDSIDSLLEKVDKEVIELEKSKKESKNSLEKRNIEEKIIKKLNTATFLISKILTDDEKNKNNSFFDMVNSGAKGNAINIVQLLATVGQPYYGNKRPKYVIPYFNNKSRFFGIKNDDNYSIESQGYVKQSYYSGIPMKTIAQSAYAAREGQISNVETVPNAGNLFRSLSNALTNVRSDKKGAVRIGKTKLQNLFGGDGLDPKKTFNIDYKGEKIHFFIDINATVEKINNKYGVFKVETNTEKVRKENNPPLFTETHGNTIYVRDDVLLLGGTFQRGFVEYLTKISHETVCLETDDIRQAESFIISCKKSNKKSRIISSTLKDFEGPKKDEDVHIVNMELVKNIMRDNIKNVVKENSVELLIRNSSIYSKSKIIENVYVESEILKDILSTAFEDFTITTDKKLLDINDNIIYWVY